MKRALVALPLLALGKVAAAVPCSGPLDAAAVVRCALGQSPDIQISHQELRALAGRHITAETRLPANPVLSVSGAFRRAPAPEGGKLFLNWYLNLSQEVEVAGQREGRIAVAEGESAIALRRLAVAEQAVAADVLGTYFDLLATAQAVALARELDGTMARFVELAEGRLRERLVSPVDADLARAERIRVALLRGAVERDHARAQTTLALLLGQEPGGAIELQGDLDPRGLVPEPGPLAGDMEALIARALTLRGEVASAEIERQVATRRIALLRRERVPSLTISVYAQRDGLDEQVYGAGLAYPLPLPWPAGRVRTGEIAEAHARAEQAETALERVRRQVRREVALAVANEQSHAAALTLFPPEFLARVRSDLNVLGEGLAAGQLSIRDALLAQRALIEALQSNLEARRAYAHAWVELRYAAGLPLPGVLP
ncbi:MAG TPA: TolC family protein [Polyangia bacterium]|jgi:outer membrane protein TolC|nr:TolC family protein [Polyangia bacterium]